MTDEGNPTPPESDRDSSTARRPGPLPGLAAICLYLLLLSGVIILGVAGGHHCPPIFLVFAAVFMAASAGLLLSFRWAWALALGAVFLLAGYNIWIFSAQRQVPALVRFTRWTISFRSCR